MTHQQRATMIVDSVIASFDVTPDKVGMSNKEFDEMRQYVSRSIARSFETEFATTVD